MALSVWRRQTRNWKIVSLRSMFNRFFENLTLAYESIYISGLGASPFQLGLVSSISHVAGTVISPPFGWLQDRYSLRKIFLVGVALSLATRYMFASAGDWVMIIPAMFLTTLAMNVGNCLTICDVSLKDEDRSTCKGICDGLFFIPALLSPTAAALVITHFGGVNVEGIRPLYWIQLAAGALLLLFLAAKLTEIERPRMGRSSGIVGDYGDVFRRGTYLKRWIVFSAVSTFSVSLTTPFTPLFAHEMKGADQFVLGGMITAGQLIQVLFSMAAGGMADRVGRKRIIYALEPLYWASILILVLAPSPLFLILSSALGGFRMIADFVAVTPLMVNRVPIDCIGRWRGILGMFNGVVSIAAPVVGGYVWASVGPSYLFLIPLAISILVKIPILTTVPEK
ncbi:hypothetical protein AC482_03440 [miscellaneous Crenarchaeota group-15 archaeon DG-45]|uniref:Major facilitator superfamily (MFS) profile domain-containing protein n=1 Tax=miscellaneous Crenarchaeota group-15 archaeon DG-45 TaxID=1685127 RepID=A0A0M0BPY1_9ARCH|nr:MAG: hypothetical protein AC482_03440 [miscellaneous Crenarchaeota group-15 archaeon DG-45]